MTGLHLCINDLKMPVVGFEVVERSDRKPDGITIITDGEISSFYVGCKASLFSDDIYVLETTITTVDKWRVGGKQLGTLRAATLDGRRLQGINVRIEEGGGGRIKVKGGEPGPAILRIGEAEWEGFVRGGADGWLLWVLPVSLPMLPGSKMRLSSGRTAAWCGTLRADDKACRLDYEYGIWKVLDADGKEIAHMHARAWDGDSPQSPPVEWFAKVVSAHEGR